MYSSIGSPILSQDPVISIYIYTFSHFISSYIYFTSSVTISSHLLIFSFYSSTTAAEAFFFFTLLLLHELVYYCSGLSSLLSQFVLCLKDGYSCYLFVKQNHRHKSISVKDKTENKKTKLLMVLMANLKCAWDFVD